MTAMNGFQLAGKELKVGIATSDMQLGENANPAVAALGNAPPALDGFDEDAKSQGPNANPGLLRDGNDRLALMQKLQQGSQSGPMPGGGGMPIMGNALPTTVIVLHGMFNPAQVNLQSDPEFFNDIEADVEQECRKYGSVMQVWPDKGSHRGDVWVRFGDVTSSANCQRALDRRWFAGQQIIAEFTTESAWSASVRG